MRLAANTERATLKWRHQVNLDTPLPTEWRKEKFEEFQRKNQTKRAELRAQRRPGAEMSALFTAEKAFANEKTCGCRSRQWESPACARQGLHYDTVHCAVAHRRRPQHELPSRNSRYSNGSRNTASKRKSMRARPPVTWLKFIPVETLSPVALGSGVSMSPRRASQVR